MKLRLAALLAGLLAAAPSAATMTTGQGPVVDHHLHIFSPDASAALKTICRIKGPGACSDEVSREPSTGADAVAALDAADIAKGVVLSAAYFFSSPALVGGPFDLQEKTRQENGYVVAQAKAYCGRLIPFISVGPLSANAVEEIDFWGRRRGAAGLKLHLGNSGFDFRSPDQVRKLQSVFAAADRNRLAIVVHLQTRPSSYGPEDARIFIDEVVPYAPHVPIQVAHVGSGGGVNPDVLAVLTLFSQRLRDKPQATRNIVFDLAMVPDLFSNDRKLSAKPTDVAALDSVMRRIGLRRFVPGSDWTLGLKLRAYYENQKSAFGFSAAEWQRLMRTEAPYVRLARSVFAGCQ